MDKNKRSLVIITVLTIIFALTGATLAYWGWATNEAERTNVVFTIGKNFSCAADGGGDITSSNVSLAPTTCTDPNYAIKREVTVTPTIDEENMTIHMNLYLNVNSIGTGLSQSLNFKYALTTSSTSCTEGVIHTGNFHGLKQGDSVKILDSTHSDETPQTYYLYVWLDKVETSSATQKQNFSLSLAGNCSDVSNADLQYNVTTVNNKNTFGVGSGFYTLSSYTCENGTTLSYDTNSKTISSNGVDKCNLQFTSVEKRLYDVVEIGDYIEYFGNNGCTGNQCNGWNANQTDTDLYENYGGCHSGTQYRFTAYGWRVLYKSDNSVYIVSAGAPECIAGASNDSTKTISSLDTAALKYCNKIYLSNGECNYNTAHPFNDDDFYKFTSSYYGESKARHLSSSYGSNYCYGQYGNQDCGGNTDIIYNGGYYWFGSKFSTSSATDHRIPYWQAGYRTVEANTGGSQAYGIRPVLKLDSGIRATGGNGTMDNPYTISERAGA